MNTDMKILMEHIFTHFTDYGKVPTTPEEFENKFEAYEYKLVLRQVLDALDVIEEE